MEYDFAGVSLKARESITLGDAPADTLTEAAFDRSFAVNLKSAWLATKHALPELRRRGGGAVVNVVSIWGREGGGGPSYNVAKAAEVSLAKALARELAPDGIRVNSVAPGSMPDLCNFADSEKLFPDFPPLDCRR